ncbi:copper amine oxidase N-terminal domain-containing protein [Paenibacillus spongiae]|uniref:Copper amine oxidase N-terminal domain-containing protein n=1 Tax=Paenibacillus spongiae TaxID=2909671 RepID=A0ABY5S9W8_9BACL|nr:copper amine oxidase N-terminal domain-containing protein [Paenibacillus spongiae]UVI29340.1 copper amine oxidase N-terminal domain-containing protein [Paenibacillus spongiae]
MLRKSRLFSLVSTAALAAAIALSVPVSASAAVASSVKAPASDGIKVTINGSEYKPKLAPFIDNGTVYLPVRDTGELLGTIVTWNASVKAAVMTYPELTVRLNYGSTVATVNGKAKELSAPLKSVKDRIYIPLRFFSEAIGADVRWNPSTKTVGITKPDDYISGGHIWLNRKTGDLYIARPHGQSVVNVGKLESDIKGHVSFGGQGIDSHNRVVTVLDNYGEPRIHYDAYSVFIHDYKIVSQKKASYFQRYEQNLSYYQYYDPNGWIQNLVLTDGRMMTVFNEEGQAVKEYDLPALAGKDENYSVLGAGEKFLVVRPNRTGFLTLINLEDNSTVELYEELLSGKDLEYARNNDVPYQGDELKFIGAEWTEDELYFMYNSPLDSKDQYIRIMYNRNTGQVTESSMN